MKPSKYLTKHLSHTYHTPMQVNSLFPIHFSGLCLEHFSHSPNSVHSLSNFQNPVQMLLPGSCFWSPWLQALSFFHECDSCSHSIMVVCVFLLSPIWLCHLWGQRLFLNQSVSPTLPLVYNVLVIISYWIDSVKVISATLLESLQSVPLFLE